MKVKVAIGWTLIAMAVALHLCFCTWSGGSYVHRIVGDIEAKVGVNVAVAGVCGLVIPIGMIGAGIGLIVYKKPNK